MQQKYTIDMRCPYCGEPGDEAVLMIGGDGGPAAGDWALCWMCLRPAAYTRNGGELTIRALTPDEEASAAQDPNLKRLLAARQECYTADQTAELLRGGR